MRLYQKNGVRAAGVLLTAVFVVLFSVRLGLFASLTSNTQSLSKEPPADTVPDRDSWMNIFQNGKKIGYSHSVFLSTPSGYRLEEKIFMRINTLGLNQDLDLTTQARLKPDFSLDAIDFEIRSDRFSFSARGNVVGDTLQLTTETMGQKRETEIPFKNKPYLATAVVDAVRASDVKPGDTLAYHIFDPATLGTEEVTVTVIGKEKIDVSGVEYTATKLALDFKGAKQYAWIGEEGEVLKEEGVLGIRLVKTSRIDALFGVPVESSDDLTAMAAVPSNVTFEDPMALSRLKVKISGVETDPETLSGGRQVLRGNVLLVEKETVADLPEKDADPAQKPSEYLGASPFIQTDNEKIRKLAAGIVSPDDPPLAKAEKLVDWIHKNIEKRPVLSMPDAISTLEHRMGDCNEHAVLLAAMARSVGLPTAIEAGLVYMKDRFYYHAWNRIFVGGWITADATFGQIPADVTHIRLASGEPSDQFDIMGMIGRIELTVLEPAP